MHSPATLKGMRIAAGLTMEQLAERARAVVVSADGVDAVPAKVTTGFLGMIETGKRQPTEPNARAIAAVIGEALRSLEPKPRKITDEQVFGAIFHMADKAAA